MKIRHRRLGLLSVSFALLATLFAPSSYVQAGDGDIGVIVNGQQTLFDVPPRMENDRTLVPMRKVFEMLGAQITWDQETTTATAVKDSITVVLKFTNNVSNDVRVNGKQVTIGVAPLEVPPKIVDDRTLVPLRFISETFGADVSYDLDLNTVFVITPMKLGLPEKIASVQLASKQAHLFVDEKGSFITFNTTDDFQGVDFSYYNPIKKEFYPLPNNTSFGVIDNIFYYTSTERSKEIKTIDLVTMQPGPSYTLPFEIYSYSNVGNELVIMSIGPKSNDLIRWNPKIPNETKLVQTPNDGYNPMTYQKDTAAGMFIYHKLSSTGKTSEYLFNSFNGRYRTLVPNTGLLPGISMDGKNQINVQGKPIIPENGLPQSNIKSWLDTKHVAVLENGNLGIRNISTGEAQTLAANVVYVYRYGTVLYYSVKETDGKTSMYKVTLR